MSAAFTSAASGRFRRAGPLIDPESQRQARAMLDAARGGSRDPVSDQRRLLERRFQAAAVARRAIPDRAPTGSSAAGVPHGRL
jgi:hypothetical protein